MSIKVSAKASATGTVYTISGLSFGQMFRIKQGLYWESQRMEKIAAGFKEDKNLAWARLFKDYAKEARAVAEAVSLFLV